MGKIQGVQRATLLPNVTTMLCINSQMWAIKDDGLGALWHACDIHTHSGPNAANLFDADYRSGDTKACEASLVEDSSNEISTRWLRVLLGLVSR